MATRIIMPPLWKNPDAPADQFTFIRCPKRIALAATGTKTGKTLGCAIWIVEGAIGNPDTTWWWIAPSHYQAGFGYERVKSLLPPGRVKTNDSDRIITLPNNSRIEFKTGEKPNLLYGAAVHGCVLDEGSRMKESAWVAVSTTMTQTMGPIRIATNTDQGKQNWVYPMFIRGQNPEDPELASFSIRTYDNPFNTLEGVETLRRNLPSVAYEALVEAVFPEDSLTVFRNVEANFVPIEWDGKSHEIEAPRKDRQYAAGLDLGKYHDFTVLSIIDITTFPYRLVYFLRINNRSWESQIKSVAEPLRRYRARCVIDATTEGDPIMEFLQREGVYVIPYKFSNPSKQRLIEKLVVGIERAEFHIPDKLHIVRQELLAFEYNITAHGNVTFSAPGDHGTSGVVHDDCVVSLALAYWQVGEAFSVGYIPIDSYDKKRVGKRKPSLNRSSWQRSRGV